MLRFHMNGTFRVEFLSGADATPRASKAQGLLALLALAANGERSRVWLQSKLWSDRGPEQAAASLRQALVQIRQAFGKSSEVLEASRQKVRLDLSRVEVVFLEDEEFLEGLDVRDQEFERWLIDCRVRTTETHARPVSGFFNRSPPASPETAWTISVSPGRSGNTETAWLAQVFADGVAQNIREIFSATVVVSNPGVITDRLWTVTTDMQRLGSGHVGVRASLEHPASGRQTWAGTRTLATRGAPPLDSPDLMSLGNQIVEAISDTLLLDAEADSDDPDVLCRRAIRMVFDMRPASTIAADALFARAYDLKPRGLFLAWRAQIRAIQRVEKHETDEQLLREAGEEFCARALETEPNNSMVLATVANTYGHLLKDFERPISLAKRSVLLNPANPMGWWALSSANVYSGNIKASYDHAVAARNLALTSPHRFWWDNQLFGAALVVGNLKEARRHAEACSGQNPDFRPPLRYLIALYANQGDDEKAARTAERLKALEPDFSTERLMKDRSYPASLIHRTPGLDVGCLSGIV